METYIFYGISYYLAADIYRLEPESFVGCSKNTRQMIVKKKIQDSDCIFATLIKSKGVWEPKDRKYNLAKPFISVEWARANLAAFKNQEEKTEEDKEVEALKAPELLELEESEKFRDVEGNVINVEIRGERSMDKIYFCAGDIESKFKLNRIKGTLQDRTSQSREVVWREGVHFIKFYICSRVTKGDQQTNGIRLFLTFTGLVKLLYVSHSPNADHFQAWSNRILFTHKFGSRREKRELGSALLGVDPAAAKEVFRADSKSLPCIYLFSLNEVKYLRESMDIPAAIPDDSIVFKYGFTKDLERRTTEHMRTLGKLNGCDLKLKRYSYIDPQFLSKAENSIKEFARAVALDYTYESAEEVVIIPRERVHMIEEQYEIISRAYLGHLTEIVSKLKEVEELLQTKLRAELEETRLRARLAEVEARAENQSLRFELELLKLKK